MGPEPEKREIGEDRSDSKRLVTRLRTRCGITSDMATDEEVLKLTAGTLTLAIEELAIAAEARRKADEAERREREKADELEKERQRRAQAEREALAAATRPVASPKPQTPQSAPERLQETPPRTFLRVYPGESGFEEMIDRAKVSLL